MSLITNGNVKVNGAVLTSPGYEVCEGDKVTVMVNPSMLNTKKCIFF